MKLRLSEIRKPAEFEVAIREMEIDLGYHFSAKVSPVVLMLSVEPEGKVYKLDGSFSFKVTLPCSRCLDDVALERDVVFTQEMRPGEDGPKAGQEIEVPESDGDLVFYESDILDPEEIVKQQLYLEIPEKPLCKDSCMGLCPRCGCNLNTSVCDCDKRPETPVAKLADFRREKSEK